MSSREQATGEPASRLIDQRIRDLGGWRGETLARMRALILEAEPEMTGGPAFQTHRAKGDRHPRRGKGRRGRVQGPREGRGGPECPAGEKTVDPEYMALPPGSPSSSTSPRSQR